MDSHTTLKVTAKHLNVACGGSGLYDTKYAPRIDHTTNKWNIRMYDTMRQAWSGGVFVSGLSTASLLKLLRLL